MNITSSVTDKLEAAGFLAKGRVTKFPHRTIEGLYIKANRSGNLAFFSSHSKSCISDGFTTEESLSGPAFDKALAHAIKWHKEALAEETAAQARLAAREAQWLAARKAFATALRANGLTVEWSANSDTFKATNGSGTSATFTAICDADLEANTYKIGYLFVGHVGFVIAKNYTAPEDKAACVAKFLTCLPWFA